tara:strand:+ start:345 stop:554 length:210 start_codon:yes stop_codon:yes gene_type:complete
MKRKLRVPVIRIISLLLPAIKSTVASVAAARLEDSDEGEKVTREEWEDILAEAMLALIPKLAEELKKAN